MGRTLAAALLTTVAIAALLVGWLLSGSRAVAAEQRLLRDEPRLEAERAARELAAALGARLEELRHAEDERPYFHYQNLFHDPRGASEGRAVVPSPLATGPTDPLVRVHLQIDGHGRVSLPTINDELPELSITEGLEDDRRWLAALEDVAPELRLPQDPEPEPDPAKPVAVAARPRPPPRVSQRVELEEEAYVQNQAPAEIYRQARNMEGRQQSATPPQAPPPQRAQQQQAAAPAPAPRPAPRWVPPPPPPPPPAPPARVTITVTAFAWRAATVGGETVLLALREVDTPDGRLRQGLVVPRERAERWLAERSPGHHVRLVVAGDGDAAVDRTAVEPLAIAGGGWQLIVDRADELGAAARAEAVRASFLSRFVLVAALAVLCGVLVVLLVARAERLARERARFAAAAAHELRTPLAGLQLYGEMLSEGLGDPKKARDYARRMAEEASRLGRVVSNVLGFAQLERGALAVSPRADDAARAVHAAVERARPALARAGATVAIDVPDALPARFDADAVARILANLIDNAEKYGGGGEIEVSAAVHDGAVEIAVADHGAGVPPRARLFRPFTRGVDGDGPAGLGLGLALSRSLARAMGGELAHRPTVGGGATFVLTLPTRGSSS